MSGHADVPSTTDESTDVERAEVEDSGGPSRRTMFVGAAAAVVAGAAVKSGTASAADGDAIIAGQQTTSGSRTELIGPSFVVSDGRASGSLAREVVAGVVTGVHGFTDRDTDSRAVWGLDRTTDGTGVYGQHGDETRGTGVIAESGNGPGLVAIGTGADVVLRGSGQLRMMASQQVGATSPGNIGTLVRENDGTLWYCYAADRWQRLAGRSRASTFVAIDPTRVYDSRPPVPIPGALAAGGARVFSVQSGHDLQSGGVIDGSLVPFDATAVAYNLTVVRTINSGFLSIASGDAAVARASAVNWTATGQTVANAGIVPVDVNGNVKVFCGGDGATDFIVDVSGYYN